MKPVDLKIIAYAGKFHVFHYQAGQDDVDSEGYFNPAHSRLGAGDLIIVSYLTGKGNPATRLKTVLKSDPEGVVIAGMGKEHLINLTKGSDT